MRNVMRHGKENYILDDWVRMFRPNWREVAKDESLGRTELRVLVLCATTLGRGNQIQLSQREMAEELHVTPQSINRAMRVLVEGGLILQDGHKYAMNSRLVADQTIAELLVLRHQEVRHLLDLHPSFQEVEV